MALIALSGTCTVEVVGEEGTPSEYRLQDPRDCLVLEPGDWHQMRFEKTGTVLLCLASEEYDPNDYVR